MTPEEAIYDDNFNGDLYSPRKQRHHFNSTEDYLRYLELKIKQIEDNMLRD